MILKQYYLACLSHASYLIGDESSRQAVVVDPQRDIDQYLAEADRRGLKIAHVLLTHFHADFVAGHLELARRTGATIHLGAKAKAEYPFHPLRDGDAIELGQVRLQILETPGHTPEGISIVVFDLAKNKEKPQAVLTGDTLFVGDVGRPDLMASVGVSATELASAMYDSLHEKLMKLPDDTLVYPAHGAGSMCGRSLSKETFSTIGAQRATNYMLRPMSRAEFVAESIRNLPLQPAYFRYDAELNQKQRPMLEESLVLGAKSLSLDQLLAHQESGGIVLDTREPDEFARGHLRGSINIGLSGKYATWAGTLLPRDRPIALVCAPGKERESALRLGRIGLDRVVGALAGGTQALEARNERVDALDLAARLKRESDLIVLDVRAQGERDDGHIAGSLHIPLDELERRAGELPSDKRLALQCAGGYRSSIAASLLERAGRKETLLDLRGGMGAWRAAGLPVTPAVVRAG